MHPKTILIVEDNVSILAAYMQILEAVPLDTIPLVAPTYEKAKQIFSLETLDLIILDLVLPDVISTDILKEIREKHPGIPLFLITGHPEMLDRKKVEAFQVKDVFLKPFDTLALIQSIQRSLLETKGGSGPAEINSRPEKVWTQKKWQRETALIEWECISGPGREAEPKPGGPA